MGYSKDNLEELMSVSSLTTKQKIDELLRIDCKMYTNLVLDQVMGRTFLTAIDSK